jgi:hypothetical protein
MILTPSAVLRTGAAFFRQGSSAKKECQAFGCPGAFVERARQMVPVTGRKIPLASPRFTETDHLRLVRRPGYVRGLLFRAQAPLIDALNQNVQRTSPGCNCDNYQCRNHTKSKRTSATGSSEEDLTDGIRRKAG